MLPTDQFLGSSPVGGEEMILTGTNLGASKEPHEPNHASNAGGKSVWWTWEASGSGTVTIDTAESAFDTLLAVYTGETLSGLSPVAANDDAATGVIASRVSFSADAGKSYRIAVDGYNGDAGEIVLNLRLGPLPPQITVPPQPMTVLTGSAAKFSVTATGAAPLSFQWFKDGAAIPAAVGSSYTLSATQAEDAGIYQVAVSNSVGHAVSSEAALFVVPVSFARQPQDLTLAAGFGGSIVSSGGRGTAPHSLQWYKDGVPVQGATNKDISFRSVQYYQAGQYWLQADSADGSARSSNVVLEVVTPYTFVTFAGLAGDRGTNDGWGNAARFAYPYGIAVDAGGSVYVTELGNYAIRKITPDGWVSTVARLGPTNTQLDPYDGGPWGLAVDAATNLYVADTPAHTILKLAPDGTLTTLAGLAGTYGRADGTNATARFYGPSAVALDSAGNLFVADRLNNSIRKITPQGVVTTVAGRASGLLNGRWTKARFTLPAGLVVDTHGNLVVAEPYNNCIRSISADGWVTTFAGPGRMMGFGPDGPGKSAVFAEPHGPALDRAGNLYIVDMGIMNRVRRITPQGMATTLAGANASGQSDGIGAAVRFHNPRGIAVDPTGTLFVTDFDSHTIRKGAPFAVAAPPPNLDVIYGEELELRVEATGAGVFAFEWTHDDKLLFVETSGRLRLHSATRAESGKYAVVVRNAAGSWLRFETVVRVIVPPVLAPPEISKTGSIRLRFRGSDGEIPADLAGQTLQWRSSLPSGQDTNWTAVPAGLSIVEGWVVFDYLDSDPWPTGFYRVQAP